MYNNIMSQANKPSWPASQAFKLSADLASGLCLMALWL